MGDTSENYQHHHASAPNPQIITDRARGTGLMATLSSISSSKQPCRCYIGSEPRVATLADAKQAAAARGLRLTVKTAGPAYRIACHDGDESGPLVAESSGFLVRPLKLQHCDSMRIFNRKVSAEDRQRIRGGSFWGLSLIVVVAVLAHGYELGCTKAEALAINDDDYQHRRLVKFYRRLGFEPKLEVGSNGLADLPHLLVWGGAGTRIDGDIRGILSKWGPKMRQLAGSGAVDN